MVNEITIGQRIDDFFVLRKIKLRTHEKKGEAYLSLELGDASGRIFGTLWHHIESVRNHMHEGELVKIKAKVIDWKGKPHLAIDKVRLATDKDDIRLNDYIPKSGSNPDSLYQQALTLIEKINSPWYRRLVTHIYTDPDLQPGLLSAAAGKLWHHCYQGGLLEHSLAVTRLVIKMTELYPALNPDLLTTAALLHDIGKIRELETSPVIEYTDEGRLLGHIALGYHLVASRIDEMEGFPIEERQVLLHLILSHQGKQENGSPVVPMTREAFALHYADELDSRLNAFERVYQKEKNQNKSWSSFVRLLERFFYFGPFEQKNENGSSKKT